MDGGPATLAAVAELAGVSLATASRVVNGSARKVGPELEQRVRAASVQLGYVVDARAQAMALGADQTVALIVGDIADPYFSGIAAGLISASSERGLMVTLIATGNDPDGEIRAVKTLRSQRPRAIVLAGSRRDDQPRAALLDAELSAYEKRGGHIAFVGSLPEDDPADRTSRGLVEVHNRAGAAELGCRLTDLGYENFVVMAGPAAAVTPRERVRGFINGISSSARPIPLAALMPTELSRDDTYHATRILLRDPLPPRTCVFAVTDAMALGVMTAVRDEGLRPGRDVGVAGFDDIMLLRDVIPNLTTVAIPLPEIGRRALGAALGENELLSPVEAHVVIRESTPRIS
ncbi:LacI family DNA-binding transcriptional regulator [Herbiconiux liukaitaii]|uniref:LacI family DNA-binding transcriptional regulator n=1 Tax=Herbiconiux liukaitaii TaxID=3342799 RepID=UPI0035B9BDF3